MVRHLLWFQKFFKVFLLALTGCKVMFSKKMLFTIWLLINNVVIFVPSFQY